VHPFLYGLSVFQPVVERLCQDFRIVTVDGRGTGRSDPLPDDYDMDGHVQDYAEVFSAIRDGGPITAIGISRGVNLLIRLAVEHPGLVDRMVLVGGHVRQTIGLGIEPGEAATLKDRHGNAFMEALAAGNIRWAIKLFARTIYSEVGTKDLRQQFIEDCLKLPTQTVRNFFTYDPRTDVSSILSEVRTPTLVMHGMEDRDNGVELGMALAEAIPGAEFYGFEGKGHLPTFTATEEFCARLLQFVREDSATDKVSASLRRPG
jgi:pimeloyl-ACP methyl ester carboxylesterase